GRRRLDQALRLHALRARPGHGRPLPARGPVLPRVARPRVRFPHRVHRARREGQHADALPLRGEDRAGAQRHRQGGQGRAHRDPRRLLQGGHRRRARVARAEDHQAAGRTRRRPRRPRPARARHRRARAALAAPGRGARQRRPCGDRHRPPGDRPGHGHQLGSPRRRPAGGDAPHARSDGGAALMADRPVRVAVVGLGYWGPNLARNFAALPGSELRWLCDADADALARAGAALRSARTTTSLDEVVSAPEVDAVAIATRVPTHAELAVRVLGAGKHCFVEKPLALNAAAAERVVEAARAAGRVLMVGHLLEYHPGVTTLKEIADSGELGEIHYIYSNRLNLGVLREDENALWSLGAHDVSVVLHLAGGEEPFECEARGESYTREGIE